MWISVEIVEGEGEKVEEGGGGGGGEGRKEKRKGGKRQQARELQIKWPLR